MNCHDPLECFIEHCNGLQQIVDILREITKDMSEEELKQFWSLSQRSSRDFVKVKS